MVCHRWAKVRFAKLWMNNLAKELGSARQRHAIQHPSCMYSVMQYNFSTLFF